MVLIRACFFFAFLTFVFVFVFVFFLSCIPLFIPSGVRFYFGGEMGYLQSCLEWKKRDSMGF